MTIADWLFESMEKLGKAGVDSPRRDALVLLEDTLGKDRTWVLAHAEHILSSIELKKVNALIERRTKREPLAYIRGKAWFYGRFFEVSPDVLIPRPESEDFISTLKKLNPKTVVDIGTGSGTLAITTKLEMPKTRVIATDIDNKALEIAKNNAHNHNSDIEFLRGSLLEPLRGLTLQDYVIITNLPYVPDDLVTSPEIKAEPKLALFSGQDGLDNYRKFWKQIVTLPDQPNYILTESLLAQHKLNATLATAANYRPGDTTGLVQTFSKN